MSKPQQGWYVKRKGKQDLGPRSHREARASALIIARAGQGVPELYRQVGGKTVKRLTPRFPELRR